MNLLDLLIGALVLAGIVGGYRLGFITRVLSWVGMAVGLFIGVKALPPLLERFSSVRGMAALALTLAVLGVCALGFQAIGFAVGGRVRPRRPTSGRAMVDRIVGGLVGGLGAFIAVWLLVPLAARTPGEAASLTANSATARWLDGALPDPPDTVGSIQAVVGDGFPKVFESLRPTPEIGPPPESTGLTRATADRVARSVVKVEGVACNRIQDGSGFVVDDDLVVTNAHVVSGERTTQVQRDDGTFVDAEVWAFDPRRDLAILRVPGLNRPALPIGESVTEGRGGVFGHPGGEPLRIAPFRVSRTITAVGRDIYDRSLTERAVLELASSLRPGDSGSALVDPEGRVVGVAFAIAPDRSNVAYALSTDELRAMLRTIPAARPSAEITGACI